MVLRFIPGYLSNADFEYMPCAELLRSTDVQLDHAANRAQLLALAVAYEYYEENKVVIDEFIGLNTEFHANAAIFRSDLEMLSNRADFKETQ
jgi:hypothetical protein